MIILPAEAWLGLMMILAVVLWLLHCLPSSGQTVEQASLVFSIKVISAHITHLCIYCSKIGSFYQERNLGQDRPAASLVQPLLSSKIQYQIQQGRKHLRQQHFYLSGLQYQYVSLWHKLIAKGKKYPLFIGGFGCLKLSLHGIRELS